MAGDGAMNDWISVQFNDVPDPITCKSILYWAEQAVPGKFHAVNRMSQDGQRTFGVEFERAEDARIFRRYWLRNG